ncbi:ring-cleaving dioxygenase [Chryseolinea sp. T2]|uniref:ring-cleaving dioxygenase n=1 Tax=Chryseolinea sp. T2 TaxID=3129255 RepID=UPI0030785678
MKNSILGLHHVTAIAGNAKRNFDFYTRVLGIRLVKKTVNFDDPGTYHFYFGDEVGTPGSILTFFPWEGISSGTPGAGQATEVVYAVPAGSLDFWKTRLEAHQVKYETGKRFGDDYVSFKDPDGLPLTLLVSNKEDNRKGWSTAEVAVDVAIKGFHSVTLTLNRKDATEKVLELLGYKLVSEENNRYRFATDAIDTANVVDILEVSSPRGVNAAGTIHHIAFRVKDETVQAAIREQIVKAGYQITPKIDRNYFFSLYFREPGGVLFEIATDNPGFATDETVEELGTHLMLPPQYEGSRSKIEQVLPVLS